MTRIPISHLCTTFLQRYRQVCRMISTPCSRALMAEGPPNSLHRTRLIPSTRWLHALMPIVTTQESISTFGWHHSESDQQTKGAEGKKRRQGQYGSGQTLTYITQA